MKTNRLDIKKLEDLLNIQNIWKYLENGNEMTVFQSFDWNVLLFNEWKASKYTRLFSQISLYIVYEQQDVVLILPVIIQKRTTKIKWLGQKKGIYILGEGSYSDYLNAIYTEISDETLDVLFQKIQQDFPHYNIVFTSIVEDSYMDRYLKKKNINPVNQDIAVAVKKPESLEAYNSLLSKHTRQNLRTALNRMEKDGRNFEMTILSASEDVRLLTTLQRLHIKRMKEKGLRYSKKDFMHKTSMYLFVFTRSYREKHNNIVLEGMKKLEQSRIIIVKIDSNIAGYLYGLVDGDTIRILQNCVDEKYSYYSPMFRGIYDYIVSLYESNSDIVNVDFTRGNEDYKYRLGGTETMLNTFTFDSALVLR